MSAKPPALAGVVGWPIGHSKSPQLHGHWLQRYNVLGHYIPIALHPDDFEQGLRSLPLLGFKGVNVTIPHKEAAMEFCTQAESSATGIGAVNTMVFHDENCLGYNTDYRAAMDCIDELFKIDKTKERPMQGMTALVLGAGGVSRAVAWGLKQRKCEVLIASRNLERAQILAAEIGCRAIEWEDRHDPKINLLVNGTPVGMHPDVDTSPYNAASMNQFLAVFDTVYNPENTMLIKFAKRAQCRIITGVDMFVRQAAYQFKLFTGRDAPIKLMRQTIKEATNPVKLN